MELPRQMQYRGNEEKAVYAGNAVLPIVGLYCQRSNVQEKDENLSAAIRIRDRPRNVSRC